MFLPRVFRYPVRLTNPTRAAPSHWLLRNPHTQPGVLSRRAFTCCPQWAAVTSQVQLRPYQEESIRSVLKYLENGEKRLGISLATGGGKTVIFSHLIDRVPPPTPDAVQTLILAHRRELVEQAAKHCRNLYPDKTVDVEMGALHASGVADITVASVQSITAGDRLMRYDPRRFKLLMVDEAHHIAAPTYLNILDHFGVATKEKASEGVMALVGVSATFSRADGLSLGTAIDHIVYHKDYVDMIEDKWLADVRFTTVQSGANLSKVKTARGDFQTGDLSRAVNTDETNEVTARSWLAIAGSRKSTLVFCVDLTHVRDLATTFRRHGYDARFVTSKTNVKVRAERLAAFKAGEFPILINCGIFTEGTDIPNIDCILLARPTKSRNLLIQMVGRGLRNSPGKQDCHIIDMVASLEKGIVTTPTLFGLDPHELVENASSESMKDLRSRKEKERSEQLDATGAGLTHSGEALNLKGNITFTHFDSVNSLIENTSGERHIRGMSRLAWVQVDSNKYILSDKSSSFLAIEVQKGGFLVSFTRKLTWRLEEGEARKSKSPYMRPMTIASTSTFEHAINAADTFAKKRFVLPMVLTSARWRAEPATSQQITFLNGFRDADKQLLPGDVTKGSAADWITKLKHGARGRFKKMQSEQAKAEKELIRDRRQVVRAGPLV